MKQKAVMRLCRRTVFLTEWVACRAERRVWSSWPHGRTTLELLAILAFFSLACTAPAYTALVAFGDSYTDTGNLPSSPPDYWNGRFSNGPLWIEDLSQTLGFAYNAANNFAVSGSESDELGLQIANFGGTSDSTNVLFAIWSGSNDIANHLSLGGDDAAWDTRINHIVSSLTTASDLLYQKGARRIVLFNVMDLTRSPDILHGYSASFRGYILGKIQILNSRLASALPDLINSHPGLQVYFFDIYSNFNYLLDNYSSLGFAQSTVGALDDASLSDKSFSGPGANYVFWDSQHPTAKTHNVIASWVANAIPQPLVPSVTIISPQNGAQFTAPTNIAVTAQVISNSWPIARVTLFKDGTLFQQRNTPPYSFTVSATNAGTYSLTAEVSYGSGQDAVSSPIQVSIAPAPGLPLPPPWSHQDIGSVGLAGSAYYYSNGTYAVSGSGNDIWDVADAFHYVYQPFQGDGSIVACVTSVQDTDGFAKAGVMFRETLGPGARNSMVYLTPASGVDFQDRISTNGISTYVQGPSATPPYWVKLERVGNTVNGYTSPDGTNWALLSSATLSLPPTIYAGLAVTAHNNSFLNTSTFAQLRVTHPAPPLPPLMDITRSLTGAIQLTISGSTGATYCCQISSNLVNWASISTNLNTTGKIQVPPLPTSPGVSRFYRAFLLQ